MLSHQQSVTETIRLYDSQQERDKYETEADLYAIFKATECLEKAKLHNFDMPQDEYVKQFDLLNSRFRMLKDALVAEEPGFLERFVETYGIEHAMRLAMQRLVKEGRVATKVQRTEGGRITAAAVAGATHQWMTLSDACAMTQYTVSTLLPMISDLIGALDELPPAYFGEWKGRKDAIRWHEKLQGMRAADELDENDQEQLAMDVGMDYDDFHKQLERAEKGT